MHPIVEQFVNSDRVLDDIVKDFFTPEDLLKKTFLEIMDNLVIEEESSSLLQKINQTIEEGHKDSELYNLFLLIALQYLINKNNTKMAASVFSLLNSTLNEKSPKIFFSMKNYLSAFIAFFEKKIEYGLEIIQESMKTVEADSSRYINYLTNYCAALSQHGVLMDDNGIMFQQLMEYNERKKHLSSFKYQEFIVNFYSFFLFNHLNTFNIDKGLLLLSGFRQKHAEINNERISSYEKIFTLYKNLSKEVNDENLALKGYYKILYLMSKGHLTEAEQYYEQHKSELESYELFLFKEWFTVQFAFYKGDKGKILLLLKSLEGNLQCFYLKDFYYGRYQLLINDIQKANETFNRLLNNLKKYNATERLLFELEFSKEMDLNYLVRLANGMPLLDNYNQSIPVVTQEKETDFFEENNNLLIGSSLAIKAVQKSIQQFSSIKAPVLITGETGTGKELVAHSIHLKGKNSKEPFLAINCGALTDTLLQSELFGYVAGAFTGAQKERKGIFEAAGTGTVFLDEFGDISPKLQVSLLRVLESNEIRPLGSNDTKEILCKIIVATNVNLIESIKEKKFREDLYFRLNRFEIKLPPLRERKEDIPLLMQFFLEQNNKKENYQKTFSKELVQKFMQYHWPGNIRELKNEIERLYILNIEHDIITFELSNLEKRNLPDSAIEEYAEEKATNSLEQNQIDFLKATEKQNVSTNLDNDLSYIINSNKTKTETRREQILALFKKFKRLSRNQIAIITKASPSTITNDLQLFCQEKYITKITPTKSNRTHYFIKNEEN